MKARATVGWRKQKRRKEPASAKFVGESGIVKFQSQRDLGEEEHGPAEKEPLDLFARKSGGKSVF